jgi:hypothetical protein
LPTVDCCVVVVVVFFILIAVAVVLIILFVVAIVIVIVDGVLITHQIRKKNLSLWPFLCSLIANWRNWTKLGHGDVDDKQG